MDEMRISTWQQSENYADRVLLAKAQCDKSYQRATTLKKYEHPSDDPIAYSNAVVGKSIIHQLETFDKNINTAKTTLSFSNENLKEIWDLINESKVIALRGANSATDPTAYPILSAEVATLQQKLMDIGNSTGPDDNYLFAGQMSNIQPFTIDGSTLTYHGDNGIQFASINVQQPKYATNVQLGTILPKIYSDLESLKNNLASADVNLIGDTDIANLDQDASEISEQRNLIGVRLQYLKDQSNVNAKRIIDLKENVSYNEDLDTVKAFTKFNDDNISYRDALKLTSMLEKFSLIDFIDMG